MAENFESNLHGYGVSTMPLKDTKPLKKLAQNNHFTHSLCKMLIFQAVPIWLYHSVVLKNFFPLNICMGDNMILAILYLREKIYKHYTVEAVSRIEAASEVFLKEGGSINLTCTVTGHHHPAQEHQQPPNLKADRGKPWQNSRLITLSRTSFTHLMTISSVRMWILSARGQFVAILQRVIHRRAVLPWSRNICYL